MTAVLLLFVVCCSPPAFSQQNQAELPRVSVFPLDYSEDKERYKNLSESITETIVLNLELIGEYELVPPPEGARYPRKEKSFIHESKVANIVFGKLEMSEEGEIDIEVSVYDGRLRRNRASFRETAEGFLDTFESSDRIVRSLLGAFTDREIAYGNIELINEGAEAPYSVFIDGKEAEPSDGRIPQILTGSYKVKIVQLRTNGETVLFDSTLTIRRGKTEQVHFSIPHFTKSEYEQIRRLEKKWRGLIGIDTPRAVSAIEDALAFSKRGDMASPAIGRLHRRLLSLKEEISEEYPESRESGSMGSGKEHLTGSERDLDAPRLISSYSTYALSSETGPSNRTDSFKGRGRFPASSLTAEPVPSDGNSKQMMEKTNTSGDGLGWVVAAGGGNIFDAGIIFRAFSKRLQMSLLTGFSYTSTQLLASISARAAFVPFPGNISPTLSLWVTGNSSLVLSDGIAATAGPSLGVEVPLFGGESILYLKNNLAVKLYPSDPGKIYYLPSVGIKL